MIKIGLTPISATVLFVLLAIAVGTIIINSSSLEVGKDMKTSKISDASFCNPSDALKLKLINKELTQEEFESMKATIGDG